MVEQIPDLIPTDLTDPEAQPSPVTILRVQAGSIAPKTNHSVRGEVRSSRATYPEDLAYRFVLVVPALDDYAYELLSVQHDLAGYPVKINSSLLPNQTTAKDGQEFIALLRQLFASAQFKRIMSSLMEQGQTAATPSDYSSGLTLVPSPRRN